MQRSCVGLRFEVQILVSDSPQALISFQQAVIIARHKSRDVQTQASYVLFERMRALRDGRPRTSRNKEATTACQLWFY